MKFIKKIITFIKVFFQKRKKRKQNKKNKSQPMGASFINPNATVINVGGETSVLDVDLVDDNVNEKDKKKVRQYTKSFITSLTIMACIWITWSYVLATVSLVTYANVEVLISLSEKVCEVILGAVISYHLKAFFETFSQKGMELIERRLNNNNHLNINENVDDEQAVG